jgi:hypothetical protein
MRISGRSGAGWQSSEIQVASKDRGEDVADRLSGEELAAREHFVQHDAEGPDVGALIHRSRWTISFSCAASRPSAIWRA